MVAQHSLVLMIISTDGYTKTVNNYPIVYKAKTLSHKTHNLKQNDESL